MSEYIYKDGELYHYGIKGMKWGVRRYQNPDGTLTPEGRARARLEYKEDNSNAFKLGREATVSARAARYGQKQLAKREKQFEKNPNGKNQDRLMSTRIAYLLSMIKASEDKKKAEEHEKTLIEKYGKDAVKSIIYDKNGDINERVYSGADWAAVIISAIPTFGTSLLALQTKNELGKIKYNTTEMLFSRAISK